MLWPIQRQTPILQSKHLKPHRKSLSSLKAIPTDFHGLLPRIKRLKTRRASPIDFGQRFQEFNNRQRIFVSGLGLFLEHKIRLRLVIRHFTAMRRTSASRDTPLVVARARKDALRQNSSEPRQ